MLHYNVAVSLASIWTRDSFGIPRHQVKCLWQFSTCTEIVFSECQSAAIWIWVAEVPVFFWPLLHSEQTVTFLQKNDIIPLLWNAYLLSLSLNLLSLIVLKSPPIPLHRYSLALQQWFLPCAFYVRFDVETFSVTGYRKKHQVIISKKPSAAENHQRQFSIHLIPDFKISSDQSQPFSHIILGIFISKGNTATCRAENPLYLSVKYRRLRHTYGCERRGKKINFQPAAEMGLLPSMLLP